MKFLVIRCSHPALSVPIQPKESQLPDDIIYDGKQGHPNEHPNDAPQPAKEQDGEHYPEAGKSGRISQDLWPDDVAVQLLQNDYKDEKVKTVQRILQQEQQGGRNGADERAEKGDDVSHPPR